MLERVPVSYLLNQDTQLQAQSIMPIIKDILLYFYYIFIMEVVMTFSKKALIGIALGSIAGVTSCMDNSKYTNPNYFSRNINPKTFFQKSSVIANLELMVECEECTPCVEPVKQEEMSPKYRLSAKIKKCNFTNVTRIIEKVGGIEMETWSDDSDSDGEGMLLFALLPDQSTLGEGFVAKKIGSMGHECFLKELP